MAYEYLLLDREENIAILTINRPDKYNALNVGVIRELGAAMDELAADDEVRAVIITGAGEKAFVSGADIGVLEEFETSKEGFDHSQEGQAVMNKVENLPKPVVAALNGYALGGGLELAMACDVRLASDTAKLGQPETAIGVSPGYGGTQRLSRLVGKGMAKLVILTGDMIDAQEAFRIGLVQKVVPLGELMSEAKALAAKMAANAPLSVAAAKEAINKGLEVDLQSGLYIEAMNFGSLCPTEDYHEGTTAFLEKRKPKYKGA
ncbi:MAG TPA: crotonase [Chloroflexi bacterium]|nr:crotonase [Chloroflexota bacterium]